VVELKKWELLCNEFGVLVWEVEESLVVDGINAIKQDT
jgi:hypothetical protein